MQHTLLLQVEAINIFDLPLELLVRVFQFSDFKTLLVCEQVCRLFKTAITSTANLRYTIELAIAGQEAGTARFEAESTTLRFERLKKYQEAWDTLAWEHDNTIPMLDGDVWELYGGVLAQSTTKESIVFRQLPSTHRSIKENTWTIHLEDLGSPILDFGMDPAQDLLVIVEEPSMLGVKSCRLHLLSLSSGARHPLASKVLVVNFKAEGWSTDVSCNIHFQGDYLGILFVGLSESELVIWQWKSGQVQYNCAGYRLKSFAFLSETHAIVCLPIAQDGFPQPCLVTVNFTEEITARPGIDPFQHGHIFQYPRLCDTVVLYEIDIQAYSNISWKSCPDLEVPFSTTQDNNVLVVSLTIQKNGDFFYLTHFIFSGAIISCLRVPKAIYSWDNWGPSGTRMMESDFPLSTTWVCYVNGSRFVMSHSIGGSHSAFVYDFNQYRVKHEALRNPQAPPQPLGSLPLCNFEDGRPAKIFDGELNTTLLYRVQTRQLGVSEDESCDLLCSEDSIIVVLEDTEEFRILSI